MNKREAAAILRRFNAWRRWDRGTPGPVCPSAEEIGQAIDKAVRELERENCQKVETPE